MNRVLPIFVAWANLIPNPIQFVGNWKDGNRPFQGWIETALISSDAKSEKTVSEDVRRLGMTSVLNSHFSNIPLD